MVTQTNPMDLANIDWFNLALLELTNRAIEAAATQAYQYARMELIERPMLEGEREKIRLQAAQQAVENQLANRELDIMAQRYRQEGVASAAMVGVQKAANEAEMAYKKGLLRQGDRQLALNEGIAAANQAFQTIGLIAELRGPRNAFVQQAVMHGLNAVGLSKAVDAIAGRLNMPSFQAPQAAPQPATLQTMQQDLRAAGGFTVPQIPPQTAGGWRPPQPMPTPQVPQAPGGTLPPGVAGGAFFTPPPGGYPTGPAAAQAYGQALPAPNQIVGREYFKLPGQTQQFLLGAYEAQGYAPEDVEFTIGQGMPKAAGPRFGLVR